MVFNAYFLRHIHLLLFFGLDKTYRTCSDNTCRSSRKAAKDGERSYQKEKKKRRRIKVQDSSSSGKVLYGTDLFQHDE